MKAFYLFFLIVTVSFSQSKLAEAKKLIDNKSFSKAQNLLEAEIKNQPNNAEVIELLGDAYGHQKKWDEAIEQYEKLTKIDAKEANYFYKYGGAMGMKALSISKIAALGIIGDAVCTKHPELWA